MDVIEFCEKAFGVEFFEYQKKILQKMEKQHLNDGIVIIPLARAARFQMAQIQFSEELKEKIDTATENARNVGSGVKHIGIPPNFLFVDETINDTIIKMIESDLKSTQEAVLSNLIDIQDEQTESTEFREVPGNRFKKRHPSEKFEKSRYKRERNNSKNYHK